MALSIGFAGDWSRLTLFNDFREVLVLAAMQNSLQGKGFQLAR